MVQVWGRRCGDAGVGCKGGAAVVQVWGRRSGAGVVQEWGAGRGSEAGGTLGPKMEAREGGQKIF